MSQGSTWRRTEHAQPAVLVVDDDASNREALRALMEELPYHVMDAGDVDATLNILRGSASGLVLVLDVLLPGIEEGAAVLQALHDDGRHAVVGVTASPRQLTPRIHTLLESLGAPLVTKPFDMDVLLACVTDAAQRVKSAQATQG